MIAKIFILHVDEEKIQDIEKFEITRFKIFSL